MTAERITSLRSAFDAGCAAGIKGYGGGNVKANWEIRWTEYLALYTPPQSITRHCNDCDYSTTEGDVVSCPECRGSVG